MHDTRFLSAAGHIALFDEAVFDGSALF